MAGIIYAKINIYVFNFWLILKSIKIVNLFIILYMFYFCYIISNRIGEDE
jgi:hypothetical protein